MELRLCCVKRRNKKAAKKNSLTAFLGLGSTGKRSITLRRSGLAVTLGGCDIELLEDIGKALIGYTVPFHCGALAVGNHIANGCVHLLQRVAGADEHIPEGCHAAFIRDGVFIYRQTAERGSKKVELHTLIHPILGGLGHGQIATTEYIVEGNRCRLSGKHGDTVAFLGHILVIALLGDGINAGHQIIDANFTVPVGGNDLIDTLAGDGEGNAVHLAVLAGFDNFRTAIADLQLDKRPYRVADGGRIGDGILNAAVWAVLIVRPNKNADCAKLAFLIRVLKCPPRGAVAFNIAVFALIDLVPRLRTVNDHHVKIIEPHF